MSSHLQKEYPSQSPVLKRMFSLQYDCVPLPPSRSNSEQPGSLHSSQGLQMGPVEESWFSCSPEYPQEENERSVQAKLQEEASYHAFGIFTEKQTKPQPRQNEAYNREEERKRRVSHDPFAQQRARENVKSAGAKGRSDPSTTNHRNAAHQLSGPASQTQGPLWNSGLYNQHGFGTTWYGQNLSQMYSTHKTPVPETNLPGNTPTMPYFSLPLTDDSTRYTICNSSAIQIGNYNYMDLGLNSLPPNNTCKEESASRHQAIFGKILKDQRWAEV